MLYTNNHSINDNEHIEGLTSGYSSKTNSLHNSEENLTELNVNDIKYEPIQIQRQNNQEENYEFCPVIPKNETKPYKEWYHRLLEMRGQFRRKERGSFPPFPPPPLPSAMIAASQASHRNPFDDIKLSKVKDIEQLIKERAYRQYTHRFRPVDFLPLPPPHIFLEMIKTLEPHQYIDLTYALAGAVLLELGLKVPDHFPPLPPKIEPMSKVTGDYIEYQSDVMSSESSTDGEYSDDSESIKNSKRIRREQNFKRREERRHRILKRKCIDDTEEKTGKGRNTDLRSEEKQSAFDREVNYKFRTLKKFIPQHRFFQPVKRHRQYFPISPFYWFLPQPYSLLCNPLKLRQNSAITQTIPIDGGSSQYSCSSNDSLQTNSLYNSYKTRKGKNVINPENCKTVKTDFPKKILLAFKEKNNESRKNILRVRQSTLNF